MSIRLDREMTLHFFSPLCRALGGSGGVPVLMYHGVAAPMMPDRHPYFETSVSPARFGEQIGWLRAQGWQGVTLGELDGPARTGREVVLTFDDGFLDFYETAFPLLAAQKMRATVFLPTAKIGQSFAGRRCMSWREAGELAAAGIEFGSHSVNHPKLWTLEPEALGAELLDSKAAIEEQLGVPVVSFSHPYAFPQQDRAYRWRLLDALHGAGYHFGVTTRVGLAATGDNRLLLPRLPVNDFDDEALFAAKLRGAYDWVGRAQTVSKTLFRGLRHG